MDHPLSRHRHKYTCTTLLHCLKYWFRPLAPPGRAGPTWHQRPTKRNVGASSAYERSEGPVRTNHEPNGIYVVLIFNVGTAPARQISPRLEERAEYVDRVYGCIAKKNSVLTQNTRHKYTVSLPPRLPMQPGYLVFSPQLWRARQCQKSRDTAK